MASEYDINLSNGSILATLHPLETNGPDNLSTPRFVQEVRPSYGIVTATIGVAGSPAESGRFYITGDFTAIFKNGFQFEVVGSTGNNGTHTVDADSTYDGSETIITVGTPLADGTNDGTIIAHVFRLASDVSYRFISGFQFTVSESATIGSPALPGEIDAIYTVTAIGSFFDGTSTYIPVTHGSIRDNSTTPIGIPYGEITYTNPDANTSLKLPGKGTPNYGEKIIEDLVRMVENFASGIAPDLNTVITGSGPAGDPLVGQLWYDTSISTFKHYDGVGWITDVPVATGSLILDDPENTNAVGSPPIAKIYITADESSLPSPWTGGSPQVALPGAVIWTDTNPLPSEPIFRVLSTDGNERLRVEHDGVVSTTNNLNVKGNVVVEGAGGVSVNADTGLDAVVVLDSDSTNLSSVQFEDNNVLQGDITVAGAGSPPTLPLKINSLTTNNVVMVTGGGKVGINQLIPSETLDVVGNTKLTGDLVANADVLYVDQANSWVGIKTAVGVATDLTDAMEITGNLRINSQIFASNQSAATPTYSFTDAPDSGMFYDGGSPLIGLSFSSGGVQALSIASDGSITVNVPSYDALVINDNVLTNKKYVDDTTGSKSWREPVRVRDHTLYASNAVFPTSGTIDGIVLADQDRVLFSNVTVIADKDIWVWTATGTSWAKEIDPNDRTVGDTIYVQEGTSARGVYAYADNGDWSEVGSGAGVNIRYEAIVATASQTVFNLVEAYSVGTNRLIVYVDGTKQTLFDVGSPTTSDYEETDSKTVTFNTPLTVNQLVEFYAFDELTADAVGKRETQTGLTGTPVITFATLSYAVGGNNLLVFKNGVKAIVDIEYTETTSNSITWVTPVLIGGDVLEFYSAVPIVAGTKLADIDNVASGTPSNGDALVYNAATATWDVQPLPAAKPLYVEYLSQSSLGSPLTLEFDTPAAGGTNDHNGTAALQVFVNGVYQIEGINYTAGAGNITLTNTGSPTPLPSTFDLVIYEFG